MRELFAMLMKLAPSDLDLGIAGETGTGKELTAQTIHDLSDRADGPFIVLDCSTLPSTLADATMFGFRRGAFTGAEHDQEGLFEQAHGGTLFIDEIARQDGWAHKFARVMDDRDPGKYKDLHMTIDRVYLPTVLEEHKTITAAADHLGLKRAWLSTRLRDLDLYGTEEK